MTAKIYKILNKQNIKLIVYSILLVLMFFGINFSMDFATDTYYTFEKSSLWRWMLFGNGRVVNAVIYWTLEKLALPDIVVYYMSYIGAIIFLTSSIAILSKKIMKFSKYEILSVSVAFLTIANAFSIEYFLFIEKALFMFAILLNVLAFSVTEKYFETKQKKYCLFAAGFLFVAVFTYQISLGLYVVLCLPFILKCSDSLRNFIKNNIIVASLYGGNMFMSLIASKIIFKSPRIGSELNLFKNFFVVLKKMGSVTIELIFPKGLFLIFIIAVLCVAMACVIKVSKDRIKKIFALIYIALGSVVIGFLPHFTGVTVDYSPRIVYPYACVFGILVIYLLMEYAGNIKQLYPAVSTVVCLILIVQYFSFGSIFVDRYKCNQTDKYLCEIIGDKIERYEKKNNIKVENICLYRDKVINWNHIGLNKSGLNMRAHVTGWSDIYSINYYLGTSYKTGEKNDDYAKHFMENDWDTYSDEQLIFDGTTLHLCVY